MLWLIRGGGGLAGAQSQVATVGEREREWDSKASLSSYIPLARTLPRCHTRLVSRPQGLSAFRFMFCCCPSARA